LPIILLFYLFCLSTKRGRLGIEDGKNAWTYVWACWNLIGRKWPEILEKSFVKESNIFAVIEGKE
jgi:hypothetical protein